MKNLLLLLTVIAAWIPASHAQEPFVPAPLGFQEWKDQQVLDAQNQVLRASTRVTQARGSKAPVAPAKKSARLPNDKVRESIEDEQTLAERELKRAQDGLTQAGALTFANYVDVYLPTLKGNPASLQKLAEKLSKDELAQIFRAIMNLGAGHEAGRDADARHNQVLLQTIALTSRK